MIRAVHESLSSFKSIKCDLDSIQPDGGGKRTGVTMRNYHSTEWYSVFNQRLEVFSWSPGGAHRTPPMGAAAAASSSKTDSLIELTEYNDRYLGLMYIYVISFSISARVVFPSTQQEQNRRKCGHPQENNMAAICYYYFYFIK